MPTSSWFVSAGWAGPIIDCRFSEYSFIAVNVEEGCSVFTCMPPPSVIIHIMKLYSRALNPGWALARLSLVIDERVGERERHTHTHTEGWRW